MAAYDRHHNSTVLASHRVNADASHQGRRTWDSAIADDDRNHAPRKRARLNESGHGDSDSSTRVLKLLSHDAYTVGWVAALPIEMAAAQAMLDNVHLPLSMNPNDSNVYAFGNIGNHNIVIACLPSGQYGITSAALVANNMRWSFPSIKIRLMVGIGGGVPDKVDIRLGDVVVSNPTAACPGVIQYDFGKTVQAGRFQLSGTLNKPPHDVLAAVAKLRADHQLSPSRMPEFLAGMRERNIMMDAYTYRGAGQDRLYRATYDHVGESCDDCDLSQLVNRGPRSNNYPKIHYGIVASANQVMKHGQTRHCLAHELEVLCFEMEAAGLMDSFPCLVIRGICDYSDSHKAKQWQEYAAATAAAYAKELLSVFPSEEIHQDSMADVNIVSSHEASLFDRRNDFLESLRFEEIDSRHSTIKSAHTKTCQWLLKHPDYIRWLDDKSFANHHGILWIRGKPGAGKSTLMKYAYSRAGLKAAKNAAILSFFFNARGGLLEKSTEGMHRSLLLQLLEKIPELQEVLGDGDRGTFLRKDSGSWDLSVLRRLFATAISKLDQRQVTCFIDALDECDESEVRQLLDFFEDLGQCAVHNNIRFYVCFSSRHYPRMDVVYGVRFTLENQLGHEQDLEKYVRSKLRTETKRQADELTKEILRKASGVFMWVVLVINILNQEFQDGRIFAVKKRLQQIPPELSNLFKNILMRDEKNMGELLLCIQWLLFGKRPLKPEEYYFALVAGVDSDSLCGWDREKISTDSMNHYVVSSSKGLAETTKSKKSTVQFIHESVRDFLLKEDGLKSLWPELGENPEGRSHERLRDCCHAYMGVYNYPCISDDDFFLDKDTDSAKGLKLDATRKFPFLDYSTSHVLYHCDAVERMRLPQDSFFRKFQLLDWIRLHNLLEQFKTRRYNISTTASYIFAELGMASLVDMLLRQKDTPLHQKDMLPHQNEKRSQNSFQRFSSPLHAAVHLGHTTTVEVWMRHIVLGNVSESPQQMESALMTAVEKQHTGIVELLLDAGVNPNTKDKYQNPLLLKAAGTNFQITRLLLSKHVSTKQHQDVRQSRLSSATPGEGDWRHACQRQEADVNQRNISGENALFRACDNNQVATARLLLENGIDPDAVSTYTESPLNLAIHEAQNFVKLLIDGGANVNLVGPGRFRSPLHHAVEVGEYDIVKFLIERGADVNLAGGQQTPPLHRAVKFDQGDIAELLIEAGADVNLVNHISMPPLHYAIEANHGRMVELLIERGADVNLARRSWKPPLHYAIEVDKVNIVKLLIERGADVNLISHAQSPLHYAVRLDRMDIVELLVKGGADINLVDQNLKYCLLEYAIKTDRQHIVELLLDMDAKVNGILYQAIMFRAKRVIRVLVENKSITRDCRDNRDLTYLKYAMDNGKVILEVKASQLHCDRDHQLLCYLLEAITSRDEMSIQEILDKGVDINQFCCFISPLYLSVLTGQNTIVRMLLEKGANTRYGDWKGPTALHLAAHKGDPSLVQVLLDFNANPDGTDSMGRTALFDIDPVHWQAGSLFKMLLSAGARLMPEDHTGKTFLESTLELKFDEETKRLISEVEHGISAQGHDYVPTLLVDAAKAHIPVLISWLLGVGADPNIFDKSGCTPLLGAVGSRPSDRLNQVVCLLLDKGANPTIPGLDGETPLEMATRLGRLSAEKILRSRIKGSSG